MPCCAVDTAREGGRLAAFGRGHPNDRGTLRGTRTRDAYSVWQGD